MKYLISIFIAAAAVLLAGCGKSSTSQDNTPGPGANAATDYGNTLVNGKKTADKTIDVSSLNQALQLFNAQEGHFPKTLQELVPNYVGKIPDAPIGYEIVYDAAKGEVKAVKQ